MALARYLEKRFGVKTRPIENPTGVTEVGANPVLIAPNNPDRLFLLILNLGANDLLVQLKPKPSDTEGIVLGANGGSMTLSADEDAELVGHEFHGMAITGTTKIYVLELEAD